MAIRFDSLGIVLNHIPRSLRILGFEFTILGILLAVSMMLGVIFVVLEAKRRNQNQDFYLGAICMAVLGAILGGRVFYAAFSWNLFRNDPWELLQLRNGGMAYYGALIGGWLLVALLCKVRSVSFGETADTLTFAVLLVQIATRLGDFFNRESFGQYTEWPVAMQLPLSSVRSGEVTSLMRENLLTIDGSNWIQVHPAFLYECVWCLLIFLFLLIVRRKKVFSGEIFYRYLALYGLGRFFIEYLRTDQLWIPETTYPISMILAAVFFILFTLVGSVRRSMEKKRAELKKRRQMEYSSQPTVEEDDQPVDINELLREEEEYRRSLERGKKESKEEAEAAAELQKPAEEEQKPAEKQDEPAVTEPEEAEAGQTETEEAKETDQEETEPEEAEETEEDTESEEAEAAEGETVQEEKEVTVQETEPEYAETEPDLTKEPENVTSEETAAEPADTAIAKPAAEKAPVEPEVSGAPADVEKKAVKKAKNKKKFRMPIFRKKEETEKKEEAVAAENPQSKFIIPVPPIKMEFGSEKDEMKAPDLKETDQQNTLSYEEFLIEPEPEPELITDEDIENLILEIADNEEEEDDTLFSLDEFEMEKPVE